MTTSILSSVQDNILGAGQAAAPSPLMPEPAPLDCSGELLTHLECKQWFAGCVLISPQNKIWTPKGIGLGPDSFKSSTYAGKKFVIDRMGKTTDDAWKAATQSTLWTIPKVDGKVFRTDIEPGAIITDDLGRKAVNTYVPAIIERKEGDIEPFLNHLELIIGDENDRRSLLEYLAHNVKYPGHKIPWAPLIQSDVQGVGKNVLKFAMQHCMGRNYVHPAKAKQLVDSGAKFNAWMTGKLFIIADEIKVDSKRDMMSSLTEMISEKVLEIEGKGVDQIVGDNIANWLFFTNHRDAIPIGVHDRRFAPFFSDIQSVSDLLERGMDDDYFTNLYDGWLRADTDRHGLKIIADYLLNYPIERGAIPMRAPRTTSWSEAVELGRGWLELLIQDAVERGCAGFRKDWISTSAVTRVLREKNKVASPAAIGKAIGNLGYHRIGQASKPYFWDDPESRDKRPVLWHRLTGVDAALYGEAQGYTDAPPPMPGTTPPPL